MYALWALAVLALLLVLILSTRLRILLSAKNGVLTAEARAGFLRFRLYPPPERKPQKEKPKKASEKKKPERAASRASARRILQTVRRLWAPAVGVLRKLRGAVRIDPLQVRLVYAGRDDPADAAILCGDTLALVWAVMPALEQVCRIPRPSVSVDVDFDASVLDAEAQVGLTMRVWAALASLTPLLALLRREEKKTSASGTTERAAET